MDELLKLKAQDATAGNRCALKELERESFEIALSRTRSASATTSKP